MWSHAYWRAFIRFQQIINAKTLWQMWILFATINRVVSGTRHPWFFFSTWRSCHPMQPTRWCRGKSHVICHHLLELATPSTLYGSVNQKDNGMNLCSQTLNRMNLRTMPLLSHRQIANFGCKPYEKNMILSYITTHGPSQLFRPIETQSNPRFSKSNRVWMEQNHVTKRDWWPKATHSVLEWISTKLLLQSPNKIFKE